jgi:hypothetical protein
VRPVSGQHILRGWRTARLPPRYGILAVPTLAPCRGATPPRAPPFPKSNGAPISWRADWLPCFSANREHSAADGPSAVPGPQRTNRRVACPHDNDPSQSGPWDTDGGPPAQHADHDRR